MGEKSRRPKDVSDGAPVRKGTGGSCYRVRYGRKLEARRRTMSRTSIMTSTLLLLGRCTVESSAAAPEKDDECPARGKAFAQRGQA
jgi:hypothetical protein